MFSEIAPGVYSVDSRFVDGKNGIVIGERGALAIDGSNYPDEGQAMADFIRSKGHEPDRLILTHGHGDHIVGAGPLAGGEVYAHSLTSAVIERQIPGWAERWGVSEEEASNRVIRPTVTFSDELCFDLGGKRLRAFPTPGHSEDGVSVFVEGDRVLFAGDSVVTGIVAAIGDGDSEVLEASLSSLAHQEVVVLVPGHGEVIRGGTKVQEWIRWEISYLTGVRNAIRKASMTEQNSRPAWWTSSRLSVIGFQPTGTTCPSGTATRWTGS